MIISHKHKYLFVELPHTASTAIRRELCQNYEGVPILYKHARYHEFLAVADAEERTYFTFSGIRNPLDAVVTVYFKLKTNHRDYANPRKLILKNTLKKFHFVESTDADFTTFFKKFYRLPYDNWSSLSHEEFDFVIRFESLQGGFAKALELIGLEQRMPLPGVNKTTGRENGFLSHYTPEIYQQAKRVFGPFMERWGYDFPPEWGDDPIPRSSQALFHILGILRKVHWRLATRFLRLRKSITFSSSWAI